VNYFEIAYQMASLSKSYNLKDLDFDDLEEDSDQDFMVALQIQMQLDNDESNDGNDYKSVKPLAVSSSSSFVGRSLHDPEWDFIDPCPDIRALFQEFDKLYFWNRLGSCLVEWSKRMTICAGIFYLKEGGIIRLSEPLLKFRPRKDLVDTLLHEMIHAYLYLTRNFKDRGEHGDEFKSHADRINKAASTRITVYHTFHDEVNAARQHVWRCTGSCRTAPPFYGYVKRSMNRAPGKNDTWWAQHQSKCSGTFEKVAEPESFKAKQAGKSEKSMMTASKASSSSSSDVNNKTLSKKKDSQVTILAGEASKMKKLDSYFGNLSTKTKSEGNLDTKPHVYSSSGLMVEDNLRKRKSEDSEERGLIRSEAKKTISNDDVIVLDDDLYRPEKVSRAAVVIVKSENAKKTAPPVELIDLASDSSVDFKKLDLVECPLCFEKFSSSCIEAHVNNHF
jgi:predicted SprT family Zn-dependent metalloprotease